MTPHLEYCVQFLSPLLNDHEFKLTQVQVKFSSMSRRNSWLLKGH